MDMLKVADNLIMLFIRKAIFFQLAMKAMQMFGVLKEEWVQFKAQLTLLQSSAFNLPQT